MVGQEFLDRYNLRDPLNRGLKYGVKQVFTAAGAANRQFKRVSGSQSGPTRLKKSGADYFDLTPDDEQQMIVETVTRIRRRDPASRRPRRRRRRDHPEDLVAKAAELGITAINVPEDFEGIAAHRGAVTNALVAEALAYGDMGLALPILAPARRRIRADALGQRRSAGHLPHGLRRRERAAGLRGDRRAAAAVRPDRAEDHGGAHPERLPPQRRQVAWCPPPRMPNCSSWQPNSTASRRLFIVESVGQGPDRQGRSEHGYPRRGARPGRTRQRRGAVDRAARRGRRRPDADYSEAVALARLGWASLAVGTAHAVLDYVVPYVKEREAFGEPIAHRQAVAFMCANIAIELDGLRLITWRGASRAEQGLPFAREAALAKRLGTDKGMQIGLDGVQLLGGHGYTKEHPVERWYRDLRAIGVAEGVVVI